MAVNTKTPETKPNFVQEVVKWFDADHDRIEAAVIGGTVGFLSSFSPEAWWPVILVTSSAACVLVKKYTSPRFKRKN